ncbi:hypothetical protein XA68_16126 [Ophiocordyceps unilateralis]|uniref:Uncharacterized protein n=1 Tax=Ophiocordyceps unilateralis TaxID=268505 RepID=A0A2A9P737_OPHUN|nr:hypothetical protein XA68_16126 [Ophiocordyceps unilateralis]
MKLATSSDVNLKTDDELNLNPNLETNIKLKSKTKPGPISQQDEPRVDNKQDEPRVDNKQDEPRVDKRDEDGGDEQCLPPPDRPFKSNHGHKFQHASLGVVSLGKPAVALITKDPDVSRRHKRYVRRLKLIDEDGFTGLPLVYQDVLPKTDGLDAEAPERLRLIFDELRPKDTTALREKDVKRLAKKLVDAFTMQQLVTYYKEDMAHGLQVHHMPTYEWIVEHEPWQGIRAISLSRLKPKNRQAILIVTQKWKLDVEEQVEGQGTMVVRLKPDTYKLVAQPSSWVLRSLNANYFDPSNRERIALYPATCRLIIHSRKSTAHTILARMDEMLHHTTTKRVSVKDVDKDNLTEAALDELGRITNTSLQYHSAESEISVSWIPDEKVGEVTTEGVEDQGQQRKRATPGNAQTEDAADIVLRLLSARQAPAPTKSVQIITPEGESNGQGLALMAHHRDIRALTWRDKMRQWSRCVMPISSGTSTDTSQPRAPLSHLVSLPKATKALKKVVDGEATHQLSAAFGHLLHLQPHVRAAKTAGNHRVLSPVVPHPASLTSLGAEGHDAVQRLTAIMLNFAPEPTTGLGADIPPQIRLRLPVDNEANLSAFTLPDDSTLEAVFPSFCHDILLPAEDVDVRLLQQRTLPLDARQKPLQEFLSRSEFNLLQGRLRTPSRTKLSLPTRWLAGAKKKAGRKAKSTADQTSSSSSTTTTTTTTDVPFLFTGLEIHQTIDLPQGNNYLLRYSSVEAGHLSGQRQQLSLHASSHGQALSPSQVADFVGAVDNIVRGGLFPWHDGHRLAKSKSRERFRESMLDDPLDDTQVAGDNSWKRDLHHPAYPSSSFSPSRSSRPSPSPSFSSHYPSRHRAAPTG